MSETETPPPNSPLPVIHGVVAFYFIGINLGNSCSFRTNASSDRDGTFSYRIGGFVDNGTISSE